MSTIRLMVAIFTSLSLTTSLHALTVPYTEDFPATNANWQNAANGFADHNPAGGPDDSSYISVPFSFQNTAAGDTPVVLRANPSTPLGPASGGNFIGNWLAGGVTGFRASVRHNATEPLPFFARFADPIGFPGFIVGSTTSVLPNTWTAVEFGINPNNLSNFDEGQPFAAVFDNVGRVQLGVFVPAGLAGVSQEFTFDVDQVTVDVPEPASCLLAGLALGVASCLRRRTR